MGRPTAPQRARTLAYGVADGTLNIPDGSEVPVPAHVTDDLGRPLLLMSADSPVLAALAGEPDLPASLLVTDVLPIPLADRVRGRAWLNGWLTEIPPAERRQAALRMSGLHPRPELLDFADAGPTDNPAQDPAGIPTHGPADGASGPTDDAADVRTDSTAGVRTDNAAGARTDGAADSSANRPADASAYKPADGLAAHPAGQGGRQVSRWTLLALEVAEVEISDQWGDAVVEPEVYAAAAPDPFVVVEPGMLAHLDACHRAELTALFWDRIGAYRDLWAAEHVSGGMPPGMESAPEPGDPASCEIRPLGIDRYGLWLRRVPSNSDDTKPIDLRVDFPCAVRDLRSLRHACRRLLATTAGRRLDGHPG